MISSRCVRLFALLFLAVFSLVWTVSPVQRDGIVTELKRSETDDWRLSQILLFQMVPILIDLPVAFAVLWVRYGATIVGVVAVVSVI